MFQYVPTVQQCTQSASAAGTYQRSPVVGNARTMLEHDMVPSFSEELNYRTTEGNRSQ